MTIFEYVPTSTVLPRQLTNDKHILMLLGNFWSNYYKDIVTVNSLDTGAFWLAQTEYDRILNQVLSSSILTIPEYQTKAYSLHIFEAAKFTLVGEDYFSYPYTSGDDIFFLTSTLLEPSVILEKQKHFDIVDGEIRFYIDIFNDAYLSPEVYSVGGQYVLLWAVDTVMQEYFIYDRFGVFMYDKLQDSAVSKAVYTALQYFYTNQKNITNIEFALNAMLGMPYSITDCGYVQNIIGTTIVTDNYTFTVDTESDVLVSIGDYVPKFTLIARIVQVDDYLTDPDWYVDKEFPFKFMDSIFVCFNGEYREYQYMDDSAFFDGDLVWDGFKKDWLPNPNVLYEPMTFDGSLTFKGVYTPDELPLKQPTTMTQGSLLYNFMDKHIKQNVIALKVLKEGIDIDSLYTAISKGMPAHLNYMVI